VKRLLQARGRHRGPSPGQVHRLRQLHPLLPLRRAALNRPKRSREVQPVLAAHRRRAQARLRPELPDERAHAHRPGLLRRAQCRAVSSGVSADGEAEPLDPFPPGGDARDLQEGRPMTPWNCPWSSLRSSANWPSAWCWSARSGGSPATGRPARPAPTGRPCGACGLSRRDSPGRARGLALSPRPSRGRAPGHHPLAHGLALARGPGLRVLLAAILAAVLTGLGRGRWGSCRARPRPGSWSRDDLRSADFPALNNALPFVFFA
jgi:hypothetical protein